MLGLTTADKFREIKSGLSTKKKENTCAATGGGMVHKKPGSVHILCFKVKNE